MNRQTMINKLKQTEEFTDFPLNTLSNRELGACLGLWDIGDGE